MRSLFLLMVITGSIFTFVACGPESKEVENKETTTVEKSEKEGKEVEKVEKVEKTEKKEVKGKESEEKGEDEDGSRKENDDDKNVAPKVEVKPAEPVVSTPVVKVTKYADGTYTKVGSYQSPGGNETVTVTVTVKDEMIQSVNVVKGTDNETSERFQELFIDGIGSAVVGKNLSDVKVGVVNGSSLTGDGFNKAIEEIRVSAQK